MRVIFAGILVCVSAHSAAADYITLKNGSQYEGALGAIREIGESAHDGPSGPVDNRSVIFVVDGLRRTIFHRHQLAIDPTPHSQIYERILVEQRTATNSTRTVGEVGELMYISPFNEFGRRYVVVNSTKGIIEIHQGITEITPLYCEVQALATRRHAYRWRLRVATRSIPREILSQIIYRQIDPRNPNDRLKVVTLYQQAERYKDAAMELQSVIADFPELEDLEGNVDSLRQAHARRLVREIRQRQAAGQAELAYDMMLKFPSDDIAGEILFEVFELKSEHERQMGRVEDMTRALAEEIISLRETGALDEVQLAAMELVSSEIESDLNLHNLARMADFARFLDDTEMTTDQKVALAISGWLMGSGAGEENLAVALSQVRVRDLVREYLVCRDALRRASILEEMEQLEGSQPSDLARLLAHLLPIGDVPEETYQQIPGFYQFQIDGVSGGEPIEYLVQLPPLYNPYRQYPCVVTLGGGTTPEQQIDWWAGEFVPENGMRMGQASRQGYIVISPRWRDEQEILYRYSADEHAAAVYSLQDAQRRFSIDTDRVFLSGHSDGGSAAWDIGLAHPDLWAGVIPIVATADKYVSRYWSNARYHGAFYFVHGEFDHSRMLSNKMDWNRYMAPHFDVTITEYLGRGHEHFHEDIQRIFDWMNLHERTRTPQEFDCVTLRPWDNFFWWVEAGAFPETTVVRPAEWPKPDVNDGRVNGQVLSPNNIVVRTSGRQATLWLSPDLVDFQRRIDVRFNQTEFRNQEIQPSREVMLEDVRLRGDRQHPFWARIDWVYGQRR